MSLTCYNCSSKLDLEENEKISRNEQCSSCYVSLRCCRMCKFYDESSYNECKETSAQRILDKEKANFCDYFLLSESKVQATNVDPLEAAKALFKK